MGGGGCVNKKGYEADLLSGKEVSPFIVGENDKGTLIVSRGRGLYRYSRGHI